MSGLTLGSLFDGIGVFPLAASRCGIRPLWASEIEALFLKQGGAYPSPDPFKGSVCGEPPRRGNKQRSKTASDFQLTLFPLS